MICTGVFVRYLHLQTRCLAAEKSLLATLRKKTGYTFTNCKKALEMHNNDLSEAENWLRQQAQALGWSKATKLEGRQTTQGLIGVIVNNSNSALVEINCETDFVAKNQEFHKILGEAAVSCLNFGETQPETGSLTKVQLNVDQMKSLEGTGGKSLADHLALMIGTVGENATLRRGYCLKAKEGIHISGYAHPAGSNVNDVLLGKFGGLIALRQLNPKDIDIDQIGKDLCQHIVGMNPKKIGTSADKPASNIDDETCLIYQEFLLDDSFTIKEILEENELEVVGFKRFECGEDITENTNADQSLDYIETCQ